MIVAHVRDQPPVPSSIVRAIPGELDAVILRCLEKARARRYQTMGELVTALGRIEPGPRERAAPTETEARQARLDAPVAAAAPPCGITTMSDAPGEVTLGRATAPRRWIGLALAASAASVVAVVIAYGSSGRSAEETTSAGFAPTGAAAPAGAADAPAEAGPGTGTGTDRSAASTESPPVERVPVDASISIDARSGAAPVDPSAAPRPEQVPGTRNSHRGKGGVTPHVSNTKASPDDLDHIQRRD